MSAARSQKTPVLAPPSDGHRGTGPTSARSTPPELEPSDEQMWAPPPLPSDPALRAELRGMIEQGLQDARAGQGERWDTAHARLFGRLNGAAEVPAPSDDSALQEFRRSIDAGIAEARAGLGDDWKTVQARMRARFPLPPR